MGALDRFRRRQTAGRPPAAREGAELPVDAREESRLWAVLREDPNDVTAFHRLADIVRRKAAEGHEGMDQRRAMDDAVWSLSEELAHSGQAWYPLVELARLSVHDDHDAAMRRLGTAAERDPSGQALATGLAMLREAHMPGEALNLGMGHWRPREHDVEVGQQLVRAAVEAGRVGEARRHLDALELHPDKVRVRPLRQELERLIAEGERGGGEARRPSPRPRPAQTQGWSEPAEVWSKGGPTATTGPGTGGLPILDQPDVVDLRERQVHDLREPQESAVSQSRTGREGRSAETRSGEDRRVEDRGKAGRSRGSGEGSEGGSGEGHGRSLLDRLRRR
jgi:hypothetical protein